MFVRGEKNNKKKGELGKNTILGDVRMFSQERKQGLPNVTHCLWGRGRGELDPPKPSGPRFVPQEGKIIFLGGVPIKYKNI